MAGQLRLRGRQHRLHPNGSWPILLSIQLQHFEVQALLPAPQNHGSEVRLVAQQAHLESAEALPTAWTIAVIYGCKDVFYRTVF